METERYYRIKTLGGTPVVTMSFTLTFTKRFNTIINYKINTRYIFSTLF